MDDNLEDIPEDSELNEREFQEVEELIDDLNLPPETVHYNSDDYISRAKRIENGSVPMNILELHHSFGYNCRRYFNFCVADPDTIIFASGNLIHFFNVAENKLWFRRSFKGGGIGHIVKNPVFNHIAIGENGNDPPIIIYEWPSFEIVTILWHGTTRSFSHLDFSPDGKLLASQGGEPDYLLTIWNWQQSKITLRFKSHGQEIINVMFSPSVSGHLTTSGLGHIKFWKMSKTFTGLKLKGELGRFGKTEISDIIGVYPMPDEKVVSGCEWGNILIWDEGLIKFEVCRKNRKPCHGGVITQFEYNNGELISIGMDGWIRMWFYDTIDQADPPDEDRFLEIEPVYEFSIFEKEENNFDKKAILMSIQKQEPNNPESTFWYAQDANGGLWIIDLCTFQTPEPSRKLLNCHAGPITDIASADWGPFVASCGKDNNLFIYNYKTKELILIHKFNDIGSRIIWLPCVIESTGSTLICAFESGVIRTINVELSEKNDNKKFVKLLQVLKPHNKAVTAMSLSPDNSLLVTGSEDSTIFLFLLEKTNKATLVPIGFIKTPSSTTCMTWKPDSTTTILLGCTRGNFVEINLPNEVKSDQITTYELMDCETRVFQFKSVKSEIRRDLVQRRNEEQRKMVYERKVADLEKLKIDQPEMEIDEEIYLTIDSEVDDEQLPEIFVPKIPNDVLLLNYTNTKICLFVSGYDSGYLYEYSNLEIGEDLKTTSRMIFEADDTEVRSCLFFNKNKYVFLGMQHGEIRVCRVNPEDHLDLSDYWLLPMHDNFNGYIPKMTLSYDHNILLTCGHDGNLFSFCINDETFDADHKVPVPTKDKLGIDTTEVDDIEEPNYPTLEEVVRQANDDKILRLAQEKKNSILALLQTYAQDFTKLMEKNRTLLKSQQIPQENFEIDSRITEELNNQLQSELDFVHRKMSFKVEKSKLRLKKLMDHFVEPITCLPFCVYRILKPNTKVYSFREHKLGDDFFATYAKVSRLIAEKEKANKSLDLQINQSIIEEEEEKEVVHGVESFLKGLSPSTLEYKLGVEINQMLKKYRARKSRIEERKREWRTVHDTKPNPDTNLLNDNNTLEKAQRTIGDFKLKNSPDLQKVNQSLDNVLNKYKQLLDCRKRIHYLREDFNNKLKIVRAKKLTSQKESQDLVNNLREIQNEIPEKNRKTLPFVFSIDYNAEFPEKELEIEKYKAMIVKVEEIRKSKKPIFMDLSQKDIEINISLDILRNLQINEQNETQWEREMKRMENYKNIHEQNFLLNEIQQKYRNLDNDLDELEKNRVEVAMESEYLNLFLLTLHQELIILRNFEATENSLTDTVNNKIKECAIAKKKIQSITVQMENKNKEIIKLQDKIKELSVQYRDLINENKFRDFLLRIFKKKFKQPKASDASSSSSSSDSSSHEDDTATIDSREIGIIHYDENILPLGCDKELYEAAFVMREHRYNSEFQIRNEQKKIEGLRKDLGIENKRLKLLEIELKISRDNLKIFMQDKHEKLNSIDMTVILKFHQLQNFLSNSEEVAKIRDCILFDKKKLSELYARVGELIRETNDELNKYKKSRTYLNRIKTECKQMETEIIKLKSNVKSEKIKKFGQDISVNILYEAVLRSLIYDIKANLNSIIKSYDSQVNSVKINYQEKMETLKNYLQSNTEKLNFLAVLEEEQLKLRKLLKFPPIIDVIFSIFTLSYFFFLYFLI
ncbi:cilia- and flagella-associated protein 44 [Leptopilina heterotoma]|uniref:cilia- and flagella-associated protein 44 n=1 Tax=Leptopilina heterotoma TaxID=63436 RepID=UPI001CA8BDF5|nr:cilia- and flagella-associated protein 44 [Leptopilina heterotoma]